jgi:hypothetical protein
VPEDFDIVRAEREHTDRRFIIGGEEFEFRAYFWPDHLAKLQDAIRDTEYLELIDELMPQHILEPGQEEKWQRVRSPEHPQPASISDMTRIINYIIQVVTGRPTVPSSGSSSARSQNGTGSTATSASPEAQTSAA